MTPDEIRGIQQTFLQQIQKDFPGCVFVEERRSRVRILEDVLMPQHHPFISFRASQYHNLATVLIESGFPIVELRGRRKYQNRDFDYRGTIQARRGTALNEQYLTVYARRMIVPIDRVFLDQLSRSGITTIEMFRHF